MATTKTASVETTEPTLTITPEVLAAIAKATAEGASRATRREIDNPPPAWWNGFGLPDFPKLTYTKVFFCGADQKPEKATAEEIRLFNQIIVPGFYGPDKTWEVKIKDNVLDIRIQGIHKKETRLDLPRSLAGILQVIVDEQPKAA